MLKSKVAAGIAGEFMAALRRQKYIDIVSKSADDSPGMMEITAVWDANAKGSGRMPVITKKKWDAAKQALGDDQKRAAALELIEHGKNAGLRLIARLEKMRDAVPVSPEPSQDDFSPIAYCGYLSGPGICPPAMVRPAPISGDYHAPGNIIHCARCDVVHGLPECPPAEPIPLGVHVPSMSYNPIDGVQPLATQAPAAPELTLERYSQKAFVIRGNTKDNREAIKAAAGDLWCAFNPRLKGGPGWIIGAENADQFRAALSGLL